MIDLLVQSITEQDLVYHKGFSFSRILDTRMKLCQSYQLTAMHGEKAYGIPVALTSSAVAAPIRFISSGSLSTKTRGFQD
ncbi:hypothetical protein H5410_000917 [Solanum commersonii]|uniref:Uncharacterized protein n=1 Tax=Solanum commersonii TaxID=4109 RepID=A0A9J6AXJ2_SOLCO|nr:hypothetical protein H5410_000917 [Solanum commersonii]